VGSGRGVPALLVAAEARRQKPRKAPRELALAPLEPHPGRGVVVQVRRRRERPGDLAERDLDPGPELSQDRAAPDQEARTRARQGLPEALLHVGRAPPQRSVPGPQRSDVIARLPQHGRPPVERRAVQEPPPPFRATLHEQEVVRREGDRRQPLEVVVEAVLRLAVQRGGPGPVGDPDGQRPLATRPLEAARHLRPLGAEADELLQAGGAQRLEGREEGQRLEQVRLPLPVLSHEHGGPR